MQKPLQPILNGLVQLSVIGEAYSTSSLDNSTNAVVS